MVCPCGTGCGGESDEGGFLAEDGNEIEFVGDQGVDRAGVDKRQADFEVRAIVVDPCEPLIAVIEFWSGDVCGWESGVVVDGAVEVDADMGLAWVVVYGVVPSVELDTEGCSDSLVSDPLSNASE